MPGPITKQRVTLFGALNLRKKKFYWKSAKSGNSDTFILFLTQLRQRFSGKHLAIIIDNYSIHKSRKVKEYLKRFPMIHLHYLPTYSPEYNPVERIWGWVKQLIYGLATVEGIEVLLKRFRKLLWHFNERWLVNPINLQLSVYSDML